MEHGNNVNLKLAAREAGQRFYTTGTPCKRNHIGKRYASTGQCVECMTGKSDKPLGEYQALGGMQHYKPTRLLLKADVTPEDLVELDMYLVRSAQVLLEHKGRTDSARLLGMKISEAVARGVPIRKLLEG